MSLPSRRVVVTGAGSGIGLAVAELLEATGTEVVRLDRSGESGSTEFDVTDEPSWAALSAVGVTGLVHAAGIRSRAPLAETSLADFRRVLDVNTTGTFLALRWAARNAHAALSVVTISSAVIDRRVEHQPGYNASKAAVAALTRSAARELAPLGTRVNAIAPGSILTPMTAAGWDDAAHAERMRTEIPLGRAGTAADIAAAAAFLLSDASAYTTGTILTVDGGWTS
ncbi:SDR family NAD(P)-dependent oxidoreductase [Leucobacter luti]|uniref:NAD(P)-dependent dehydrogenase (Short-subunit alcohol dehydrogenase family) n=1 Tax=Leucobacter luti TaxID=340320 RepID=A0A4Q7U3L7_9MICO|nr:SDR family oxidoreductase [Leucobacter luti]RZT68294.1 NAD(P)-dependent dehydrogenase (short-subunit alcohol dehydrogenase family) [Leucobacter luti]